MKGNMIIITHRCEYCDGAGVVEGIVNDEATVVVCCVCKGNGYLDACFNKFQGKKRLEHIESVVDSYESKNKMPYDEWFDKRAGK